MDLKNPIFNDETAARSYLEATRWPDGAACPSCGMIETVSPMPQKGSLGAGWYHCRQCRQKFTVRVGTLYERSHVPLHKWLLATHLLCSSKKGMSSHQLHRMLGVTYKTAWFMSHRIREGMTPKNPGPMGGEGKVIEADETYMGKRAKKPHLNTERKIIALVERGGPVRSFTVKRVSGGAAAKALLMNVDRKSQLMTDESGIYMGIGKEFKGGHESVNHSNREYARGDVSTNTIEGVFSIFKRGMIGTYQHCGEQHLQRYLNEFDFRYSNREKLGFNDTMRAEIAIKGIEGKRLTYRRIGQA
ncbi:transposase [Rhizomicrobium sp. SCGC AG-212-E05]|nr:transposase [Rhizomicrobium sp. SCGC AG-212-E05]